MKDLKYAYYRIRENGETEDYCVKAEFMQEFEEDCAINGVKLKCIAKSNSIESLDNYKKFINGSLIIYYN